MTRKNQERVRKTAEAATAPSDGASPFLAAPPPPAPILILHLRIRSRDVEDDPAGSRLMEDQILVYRPTVEEPEAYDQNPFSMAEEFAAPSGSTENCAEATSGAVNRPIVDYQNFDARGACWWCCHGFDGDTVNIPLESSGSSQPLYGYGTFCSFPCACAYLFGQEEMAFRRWERFTLLCREYRKSGGRFQRVPQAPPRQTLKMFGGTLDIDDFRKLNQRDCAYRMVTPTLVHVQPTISVVPLHQMQMSTISDVSAARSQNRSSADEFSASAGGGLRLKRSKPILDGKNTLENYIRAK